MRLSLNPGSAALTAGLLVFLTELSTSSVSTKKDCPKGQVRDLNDKCVKKFVAPRRKECPAPHIRFGQTELRASGRMISMWCEDGWEPAPPNDYAMCKLGAWDRELPRCVRPGCPDPVVSRGVRAVEEMGGAIVRFHCSDPSGLQELSGPPVLGCDGERWNGTAPLGCRDPPAPSSSGDAQSQQTSSSQRWIPTKTMTYSFAFTVMSVWL